MKTSIFILLLLLSGLVQAGARIRIQKPLTRQATAFAIFVDRTTFEKAGPAIIAYRDALEREGLSTYILSGDWESPDQVRQEIIRLRKRRPRLEGMVFVGDIPIVLLRNAQHLTTAFKMNERTFPFRESSVPTDRFYDDPDLACEFIRQDTACPLHFYYRLSETGPQRLAPPLYSGRIRYPEARGGDRYRAIASYLEKAVQTKGQSNRLDCILSYTGSGYHSECLNAWKDEALALKEQFPLAWNRGRSARLLNFRMADDMKSRLLDELQDPETDLVIFHEHGSPDRQYLSDGPAPSGISGCMEAVRDRIWSILAGKLEKKEGSREEITAFLTEKYGLEPRFFDGFSPRLVEAADSLHRARTQISLEDLEGMVTRPPLVILDACYNGSFQEQGYVAGQYLFNAGTTIAVQGNTRNVLQDRWTMELAGLLSQGVRVGQWNRLTATLEGHIMGDPTFRFSAPGGTDLGRDIVLKGGDREYWEGLIPSPVPDVRALAWRMLADLDREKVLAGRLLQAFRKSASCTERLELLKLLSRYVGTEFRQALRLGLQDSYEAIRRQAAILAGKYGDPALVPDLVEAALDDPASIRVGHNLQQALRLFPTDSLLACIDRRKLRTDTAGNSRYDAAGDRYTEALAELAAANGRKQARGLEALMDADADREEQIAFIRQLRNNPYHPHSEAFLDLVADSRLEEGLRTDLTEALGWFNLSYLREKIRQRLVLVLQKGGLAGPLEKEMIKTIKRLE